MNTLPEVLRLLHNLIRIGTITEVDHANVRARVRSGDNTTGWLRFFSARAGTTTDWDPPTKGEQALVLSPSGDMAQGLILVGLNTGQTPPPSTDKAHWRRRFPDGTTATYDHEAHELTLDVPEPGQVTVNVNGPAVIRSPKIDLGEDADLEPSVLGDKLAAWIVQELKPYADTQQHIGNLGAPTSPALAVQPFEPGTGAQGGAVYSTKNRNQ